VYTLEMRTALITDEMFEVYRRYREVVHKKEATKDELEGFLCNSPVYNPED